MLQTHVLRGNIQDHLLRFAGDAIGGHSRRGPHRRPLDDAHLPLPCRHGRVRLHGQGDGAQQDWMIDCIVCHLRVFRRLHPALDVDDTAGSGRSAQLQDGFATIALTTTSEFIEKLERGSYLWVVRFTGFFSISCEGNLSKLV